MNGQRFCFEGYLPIETRQRIVAIKDLEAASAKSNCTRIFIETPYRNDQLLDALVKNCRNDTRLCIAVDITGKHEWIKTRTISEWKKDLPSIHKRPAIYLLHAGS
jgi:16S rRNA (cytidine1402-2'-O)-methyltransferase